MDQFVKGLFINTNKPFYNFFFVFSLVKVELTYFNGYVDFVLYYFANTSDFIIGWLDKSYFVRFVFKVLLLVFHCYEAITVTVNMQSFYKVFAI